MAIESSAFLASELGLVRVTASGALLQAALEHTCRVDRARLLELICGSWDSVPRYVAIVSILHLLLIRDDRALLVIGRVEEIMGGGADVVLS